MKAISLWQPWASLVVDGRKKIETRSWCAPRYLIGQHLAIHATKKVDEEFAEECGYGVDIPRGAILGIVLLDRCEQFTEEFYRDVSKQCEGRYGDFYPGRWGWFMTLVEKFAVPIIQRGAQGIFDWHCGCDISVNHLCSFHGRQRNLYMATRQIAEGTDS